MDNEWRAFRDGLTWKPIADYDRERGDLVVLRGSSNEEAFGYWGVAGRQRCVRRTLAASTWHEGQESMDDTPLPFEPTEYAEVDDEWREHLMAD